MAVIARLLAAGVAAIGRVVLVLAADDCPDEIEIGDGFRTGNTDFATRPAEMRVARTSAPGMVQVAGFEAPTPGWF